MKLTELEPRWCSESTPENRHGMGISFLCPVHRDHRLMVMFANPVDGGKPATGNAYLWTREGETFDTLTLGPSIDASGAPQMDGVKFPCWHGFIRNGEAS